LINKYSGHMNPLLNPHYRASHTHETHAARAEWRKKDQKKIGAAMQVQKARLAFMGSVGLASNSSRGLNGSIGAGIQGAAGAPGDDEGGDGGFMDTLADIASKPLLILFEYTIPDCRKPGWETWYMGTFTMSIFWIGMFSFLMVDFASRAGCVIGIPSIVMGLVSGLLIDAIDSLDQSGEWAINRLNRLVRPVWRVGSECSD
jgi:hypothetical protein